MSTTTNSYEFFIASLGRDPAEVAKLLKQFTDSKVATDTSLKTPNETQEYTASIMLGIRNHAGLCILD